MVKGFFTSVLVLGLMSAAASSSTLTIDVFSGSKLVGTATSSSGDATFNSTSIAGYSSITVDAEGSPVLSGGDLSSTTLDAKSAGVGAEKLTVDVFQTGVSVPAPGSTQSTFTVNGLIGGPGPTTESTYFGGSSSALGTQLASHAFSSGNVVQASGPTAATAGSAFTSDAQQYVINFGAGSPMSVGDSIELTTSAPSTTPPGGVSGAVPEASTWAMMLTGFVLMAFAAYRPARRLRLQ